MYEVERVGFKGPVQFCIIDIKTEVWGNPIGLYQAQIGPDNFRRRKKVCKVDCPYPYLSSISQPLSGCPSSVGYQFQCPGLTLSGRLKGLGSSIIYCS
jgi:hypothetical protein